MAKKYRKMKPRKKDYYNDIQQIKDEEVTKAINRK